MKYTRLVLLTSIFLVGFKSASAQNLFIPYSDSVALVKDANELVKDFVKKVNAVKPVMTAAPTAILNTKPYLIFYSSKANLVNLPLWAQVIPQQKDFFYKLAGSETNGLEVFGLFFNGFYLPHELGHAIQSATKKRDSSLYANEYFANVVAMLYWRDVGREKELEVAYKYAKQFIARLKDPVPAGEDPVLYFNSHYNELGADPYKYAYFQFNQFIRIYEDKSLKDFTSFIRDYLSK